MADIVFPGQESGGTLNAGALPSNHDIVAYKGDYVEFFVTLNDPVGAPVNLVGSTPKAALKTDYNDRSQRLFNCTLTGTPGQVRVFLSSDVTSTLLPGSYIWDFQITDSNGETRTYLAGDVTVYPEVTT